MDFKITIGGQDKIVEIDECKIGRRQYNRGKWLEGQCVLGFLREGPTNACWYPFPTGSERHYYQ